MRFINIHVQDFLSVKDATFTLEKQGLVLIRGNNLDSNAADSNGSGKSTLAVDAWCWILFGKTARGTSGSCIVRRGSTEGCRGEVQFERGAEVYRVIRYQDHPDQKNGLFLICNGADIGRTDKREVQKQIEEKLGFNMQLGLNCMVLGQSGIALATMTDAEKKRIFEKVLDFDKFTTAQQKAKDKVKDLDTQIISKRQVIFSFEQQIESLTTQLRLQVDHSEAWEKEQERKEVETKAHITTLEQCATEIQAEIDAFNFATIEAELEQAKVLEAEKQKLARDWAAYIDQLNAQLRNLGDEGTLQQQVFQAQRILEQAGERGNRTLVRYRENVTQLLNSEVTTTCPTCKQGLPADQVASAKASLEQQLKEAKENLANVEQAAAEERIGCQNAVAEATQRLETFRNSTIQLRESITQAAPRYEAATKQNALAIDEYESCERKLRVQRELKAEKEYSLQQLKLQVETEKRILETKQINPYTVAIDSTRQNLDTASRSVSQHLSEIGKVEEQQEVYKFWVTGFGKSGIQSYMLDSFIPFLNQKIAEYAQILFEGEADIEFRTQRLLADGETLKEDFHVSVTNRFGADTYDNNSGGEKERVDICIALGMQDLVISRQGSEFNLCVLDEVAKYIDESGVGRYYELLRHLARSRETILVVTHSPHLEAYFDKVWMVTKQNSISTLAM